MVYAREKFNMEIRKAQNGHWLATEKFRRKGVICSFRGGPDGGDNTLTARESMEFLEGQKNVASERRKAAETPKAAEKSARPPADKGAKPTGQGYAAALRNKLQEAPAAYETVVMVSGKNGTETREAMKETVRGKEIGGTLASVIKKRDGSVVLLSKSAEQKAKLDAVLKGREGIVVEDGRKFQPTVMLTGVEAGYTAEALVRDNSGK
ncbi:hypothetical protein BDFB_012511 [Asbolus verrucosus]|uniref:Uncharacterized protein n=1 Tax=Asbolus verrucosus TaxID=1661398 RepID=A0A482VMH1_ASBVE|nr:hypothetical protein BDFB_012511 [Asbolus verrucosus]